MVEQKIGFLLLTSVTSLTMSASTLGLVVLDVGAEPEVLSLVFRSAYLVLRAVHGRKGTAVVIALLALGLLGLWPHC